MWIKRLQVNSDGFLGGLDMEFELGLNVLIGARGTGKTSIVELIRYALSATAFTDQAARRGEQQAVAILDGGTVTVTVVDDQTEYVITRTASGDTRYWPDKPAFGMTVLGQNELEAVGAQAAGRRQLVDRLRPDRVAMALEAESVQDLLRDIGRGIHTATQETQDTEDRLTAYQDLPNELSQARDEQRRILESADISLPQQNRLQEIQTARALTAEEQASLTQATSQVRSARLKLQDALEESAILSRALRNSPAVPDAARKASEQAIDFLRASDEMFDTALRQVEMQDQITRGRAATLDEESQQLRQQLNAIQQGIGELSRRLTDLSERQGQYNALKTRLADQKERISLLLTAQTMQYEKLVQIRDRISAERSRIVDELNRKLGPMIRLRLIQSDSVAEYQSALIEALRGSGLHYNNIAPLIVREVAPIELVTWVRENDSKSFTAATGLAPDRAANVLSNLSQRDLGPILAAHIEDNVELELLDGTDYKTTNKLSIGQRCTVVLPILFSNRGEPLVIDQPEDHLDNAFIATTLVPALRSRSEESQYILSSHNANIPVLGSADRVFAMGSDGKRGALRAVGPLSATQIVDIISRLMEGGREAFGARAEFYDLLT